jgi:hypothetical protein
LAIAFAEAAACQNDRKKKARQTLSRALIWEVAQQREIIGQTLVVYHRKNHPRVSFVDLTNCWINGKQIDMTWMMMF